MSKLSSIYDKQSIYNKGIVNEKYNYEIIGFNFPKNNYKIFFFIVIGIVLGKHNNQLRENIAWVNGNRGYERYFDCNKYDIIYHGSYFTKLGNFFNFNSIFSPFTRMRRIVILIKSIIDYIRLDIKHFTYWIEYCFVIESLISISPIKIVSPHIQDRQITWISYYAQLSKANLEIYQHGITPNINILPNKIYCNTFYALDDNQIIINKENIILNKDKCIFKKLKFKSGIVFSHFGKKDKFVIGIATQVNPIFINNLLKEISGNKLLAHYEIQFIMMLHPLDLVDKYILPYNLSIIVEKEKKYIDINILITENSTIIYDYYYAGFHNPIIQIDELNSADMFASIPSVKNFGQIIDAVEYIATYYNSKNNKE